MTPPQVENLTRWLCFRSGRTLSSFCGATIFFCHETSGSPVMTWGNKIVIIVFVIYLKLCSIYLQKFNIFLVNYDYDKNENHYQPVKRYHKNNYL